MRERVSRVLALLWGLGVAACSSELGLDPAARGGVVGGPGAAGATGAGAGDALSGEANYKRFCASCHGPTGEGGSGKKLRGWSRGDAELVQIIELRMPPDDPKKCAGKCAVDVAAYILNNFKGEPAQCKGDELPPRRLRLLNRREYNATVRDLLGASASGGAACAGDEGCEVASQSCVGGSCQSDPCQLRTFTFPAQGKKYKSVHVAGSFNGWPATVAAGGWPMTYLPGKDLYVTKRPLDDGQYTYKFVLDEGTWVVDPTNASSEPDGFGGQNSKLSVSCAGGGGGGPTEGLDLAKNFPVESRPKGFFFDTNAEAGLVTSIHVDQYLLASAQVAKLALGNLAKLSPCADPGEASCREAFVRAFGRRAFRRPLTEAEVGRYTKLAQAQASKEQAVEAVVRAMVMSPFFLYRSEMGAAQPDGTYRLTPHEVASALSYMFWGTMPDAALAAAADKGELSSAEQIEAQARRLLADPRARSVVGVFAVQWLGVESVAEATRSNQLYPSWSASTGAAMTEETRRFVEHVFFDGSHKLDELLTSDRSFLDGELAALYGASAPAAAGLAQVPPERRAGLLGHGSVLASTSHSDQSSPIRRGLFLRERLLCQEFGQPPPNAGGVPEVDPKATTRERFRQHTDNAFCKSCHQYIDEVGFGFERFDAIGRYRTEENGQPIDPSGNMNDVEGLGSKTDGKFASLPELASVLVKSDALSRCFTRQVYRFSRGALEQSADLCAVDALAASFDGSGRDLRELLVATVKAPGFTARR